MKSTLLIFLGIMLFSSCQKQEYVTIDYDISSKGNGVTMISFDDIVFDTLHNGYNNTIIYPVIKSVDYDFGVTIINRTFKDSDKKIFIKIYINNELMLDEIMHQNGCGSMNRHYELEYSQ